jgi:hypothetical protein
MEPEGSLPCSQEPSTGPYPKPDQSSPHHPILNEELQNLSSSFNVIKLKWSQGQRLTAHMGEKSGTNITPVRERGKEMRTFAVQEQRH